MSINRELAEWRGLDEITILEIERIHALIDKFTTAWVKEPFKESRKDEIHSMEYLLQQLWGFPQDCGFHRYADDYEFKCHWVGKKYRCVRSGEVFVIPDSVHETACYFFGEGAMVDVGRHNAYCRFSGVEEVKDEVS